MGTTHVSVLTEDGSAVSVTSSINHIFGSRFLSPSTGIILNDVLFDFCTISNFGEQPPSSMAPVLLKSQLKTLVVGLTGGSMTSTGMALIGDPLSGFTSEKLCLSKLLFLCAIMLLTCCKLS
ncbi:glutathione hydrolase light chain 1-like isoform X2 [Simochromis diagramma]|uniref:glutathione hydrolase light chain 1-like isoform X2 n=1 Tax=Simochromis diagramma TaxID=43689 RepID=UPI001A7ED289|nr:glutathione hydrolase light chain 1-like isoform X2 [Simochromis diagramma]